jgi:hypothetical protein
MKTLLLASLFTAACGAYSPSLGTQPFACGDADPKCPDGYDCVPSGSANLCVKSGGEAVDASNMCADDSALEPNNTYTAPYVTPVASQRKTISLGSLAICPAGDVDVYEVQTTAVQNLEAIMTYVTTGTATPLTLEILSPTGTMVVAGTPMSGMQNVLRAYVASLPTSSNYFVQVASSTPSGTNNYSLQINVTP